jgi:hypothetical protein
MAYNWSATHSPPEGALEGGCPSRHVRRVPARPAAKWQHVRASLAPQIQEEHRALARLSARRRQPPHSSIPCCEVQHTRIDPVHDRPCPAPAAPEPRRPLQHLASSADMHSLVPGSSPTNAQKSDRATSKSRGTVHWSWSKGRRIVSTPFAPPRAAERRPLESDQQARRRDDRSAAPGSEAVENLEAVTLGASHIDRRAVDSVAGAVPTPRTSVGKWACRYAAGNGTTH